MRQLQFHNSPSNMQNGKKSRSKFNEKRERLIMSISTKVLVRESISLSGKAGKRCYKFCLTASFSE